MNTSYFSVFIQPFIFTVQHFPVVVGSIPAQGAGIGLPFTYKIPAVGDTPVGDTPVGGTAVGGTAAPDAVEPAGSEASPDVAI